MIPKWTPSNSSKTRPWDSGQTGAANASATRPTIPGGNEHPNLTLNRLVDSVRFVGGLGVVGVFLPQDPGGPDKLAQQGQIAFDYGNYWFKGQTMGSGQCPVKKYNRALRDLIAGGKASPSFLVSHELPLDQAPEGYKNFDNREDGWTKVVLHPAGA